jgi:hypothetical protein
MKQDDPVIARIRESRRRISEKNHHDPREIVRYYLELQSKYREKLLPEGEPELPRP